MKVNLFLLFVFLNCFQFGIDDNFTNSIIDIIKESEITFIDKTGGILWDRKDPAPNSFKYNVLCINGKLQLEYINQWDSGKKEVYKTKKGMLNKYLKLWNKLFNKRFFNLIDKSYLKYLDKDESKTTELAESYEKFRMGEMLLDFSFKIKNYKHSFEVYDPEALKDKRYLQILNDLCDFFGLKEIKE